MLVEDRAIRIRAMGDLEEALEVQLAEEVLDLKVGEAEVVRQEEVEIGICLED